MIRRCLIHISILKLLLVKEIFSKYAYFDFKLTCVDDFVKYINSSEGLIYPENPNEKYNLSYIYNFEKLKQDLDKKICIHIVNAYINTSIFSFEYASINEYIFTQVNYENWYSCDDCDYDINKKFIISDNKCKTNNNSLIIYSNGFNAHTMYTFCLKPKNDITNFYINDSKINKDYYKGKKLEYFINNDTYNIPVKDLFSINGFDNLEIILDTISLEISSIQNGKGKIFNGNEELFERSFFNPNISLTFKRIINDGYFMIIRIKTKPRDRPSSVSTCVNETQIYLYVSQKNCSMDKASDDYCQKCMDEYGKSGNDCYHRTEKFTNLYYDEQSQTFKQCEKNNTIYNCSICPEGTHIFKKNSFSNICKKCPEWKYTYIPDQDECISCDPHCINCNLKGICLECNNNALNGFGNCSVCENKIRWEYDGEFCKTKCSKYFYRDNKNNIHCIQEIDECPKDMIYLNLETGECRKEVSDIEIIKGKYQLKLNENELKKESNDLFKKIINDKDLFNEIPENGIKIEGYNEIINMGIANNNTIKTDSKTINFGECLNLLRINLKIIGPEQNFLYQNIDLKVGDNLKDIKLYNSENLDESTNLSYCKNNITEIRSINEVLPYLKRSKYEYDILRFIEQGLDIFNAYSPIYNDPCYPLSTINKIDLTLNDRREDMIKMNVFLCKPGCSFEGVNIEAKEVLCFCKDYVNTEQKSISDGFTEGLINLGKSKNIYVIKCIKSVFNFENQKYNYISELINNKNTNNNKNNKNNNKNNINNNDNLFELIRSFFNIIYELFSSNFLNDYDITNIFISKTNDDYSDINITSIKIIMFINKNIIILFFNTLFLDDEAMHNIKENNGKYNIIYRLPVIFFSELASWIIGFLFFEFPISFAEPFENNDDVVVEKFKERFKKIRIAIYINSFIINLICWYYISCFFSIFQNTQIHLLNDFGSGLLMNLIISLIKSFLYAIYKYIFARIGKYKCLYEFVKILYGIFNQKFIIFIFEVIIEILIIYITKFDSFQNFQKLFD